MKGNKLIAVGLLIAIVAVLAYWFAGKKRHSENAMVELGRYLFFDRRLSINNTRSCATCHNPQFAFTDGYKRSLGALADLHQRNTQPLFNLSYLKYLTAADSTLHSPLQQMNSPLFGIHPIEMGIRFNDSGIINMIKEDPIYVKLFARAFKNKESSVNWQNIKTAITWFINTIVSTNTPFDKYKAGDTAALTVSQKKGMQLFFSPVLKCSLCHGGFNFSTPSITNEMGDTMFYFNTGLYNVDAKGSYPAYDMGLYQLTQNNSDMGKFRVPSLRNLAFTAPYFHDGSAASLNEVVTAYENGGRLINNGQYAGDGSKSLFKHALVTGFKITAEDKQDIIDFLLSLSDSSFISNPAYQNPFDKDETRKK
jgi:cytochrome c peroxidase